MNLVKVNSTKLDDLSRRLIKFLRKGKSDIQERWQASPFGDDSNPVKDMVAVYSETTEKGKGVIIGYLNKDLQAAVGEKRLYSTDTDGALSFYLWLKNDGTCLVGGDSDNMVRYSKLEEAFNELKDDFNTLVNTYNAHTHTGVTAGPGSTGTTPATGTTSAADITPSKIDEIKTL
jgi:hypothetical protein